MNETAPRNRLMPWYIGIAIVLVAVCYLAYQIFFIGCEASTFVELIALIVLPVVYLGLMYLTLTSQK
jgi:hypothetical protein